MDEVTVREATPNDVADIRRVAERGWHATYRGILSQDTIDAVMTEWYGADRTRGLIEREELGYFVAEQNGDLVGYVSGGPSGENGVATLGAIYVDPDYWNNGIGTALLEAFETFCLHRRFEKLQFNVLAENDVGTSFHRKHGYEAVEERETELLGAVATEYVFRGRIE